MNLLAVSCSHAILDSWTHGVAVGCMVSSESIPFMACLQLHVRLHALQAVSLCFCLKDGASLCAIVHQHQQPFDSRLVAAGQHLSNSSVVLEAAVDQLSF